MTLAEFDERVFSVAELYDLASEEGCYDLIEDIYYRDSIEEFIDDQIRDYLNGYGWESLRNALDSIDLTGDLYVMPGGLLEFECIDDDEYYADDLRTNLRSCLVENGYFDDEGEGDEDAEIVDDPDLFDEFKEDEEESNTTEWYDEVDCDVMLLFA